MSIGLYSLGASEAEKLVSDGFEISVGLDEKGEKKQINITRDDGETVYYNNIYNTTEIDQLRISGQITDNSQEILKGFPDILIYKGGSIPAIQSNGSTNEKTVETLKALYKVISESNTNSASILAQYLSKILEKNGTTSIIDSDLSETMNKIPSVSTYAIQTETFEQLLTAISINSNNAITIINQIFEMIDKYKFEPEKFIKTALTNYQEPFYVFDKVIDESDKSKYYLIKKEVDANTYQNLIQALYILASATTEILEVNPNFNLDVFQVEEQKDEENNTTNISYSLVEKHVQTLTELIWALSFSNKDLKKWLSKIETMKTTGINPDTFGNMELSLSSALMMTEDSKDELEIVENTSLNNLIYNISENNRFLFALAKQNKENINIQTLSDEVVKTLLQQLNGTEGFMLINDNGNFKIVKSKINYVKNDEQQKQDAIKDPNNEIESAQLPTQNEIEEKESLGEKVAVFWNTTCEITVSTIDFGKKVLTCLAYGYYIILSGLGTTIGKIGSSVWSGSKDAYKYFYENYGQFYFRHIDPSSNKTVLYKIRSLPKSYTSAKTY